MTEKEIKDKICDFDFAEPLFHFVEEKCFDDFCEKSIEQDISIAEYVSRYQITQFRAYCQEKGMMQ